MKTTVLGGLMTLLVLVSAPQARAEFALGDDDRVVFFGNKVAWGGEMPMSVETYVRIRYPELKVRFRSCGWQAAGILKGTIERFEKQVAAFEPTVVVLCFGTDDVPRGPYREDHHRKFVPDFTELVERVGQNGARVYVMTPLCPEVAGRNALQEMAYDQTIAKYAEAMRTIASDKGAVVIDWFAASQQYLERHAGNQRLAITAGGTLPSPLGFAIGAAAILEAWSAEPLAITVEADWIGASASCSVGQVALSEVSDDKVRLKLSGLPIPWVFPKRGSVSGDDWPLNGYFSFLLRIVNVPNGGIMISEADGKNALPYLSEQLRRGADMCFVGPLTKLDTVANLDDWMKAKYRADREHQKWVRRPLPEPEYEQAYATYSLGLAQYVEATDLIVRRQPRTIETTLEIYKAPLPAGVQDPGGAIDKVSGKRKPGAAVKIKRMGRGKSGRDTKGNKSTDNTP